MSKELNEVPTNEKRRWSSGVQPFKFEPNKWHKVRIFGPIFSDFKHGVVTKSKKTYPEWCLGYDIDNDEFYANREERCPCCKVKLGGQLRYFINLIDLDVWKNRPAEPDAEWSPIRFAEFSQSLIKAIKALIPLNDGCPITHPDKGAVIMIKYNPAAEPAMMYQVSLDAERGLLKKEWLALSVVQTMNADLQKVIRKPTETLPGMFIYDKVCNTREDMLKSLERNGYFGATASAAQSSYTPEPQEQMQALPKLNYEEPAQDEAPPARHPQDKTETSSVDPTTLMSKECPTSFGKFASDMTCYTKCKAKKWCREASLNNTNEAATTNADDTV